MGTTTDYLNIVIRANGHASYANAMHQATTATNGFNASVGSLISTLAKVATAGAVTKFSKQCIDAASDLQEVSNVIDVTFGQKASKVDEWAKNQASSFGLSETAAKRYIGTYGTMAKQFQFTTEQAAGMSIELAKLTGDVASFYNLSDKLAADKLKSIFTGETESLKELGVVMTEANLNAFALSKGKSKPLKEMNEHEKTALRYEFVLDKLSHAQGDFARTSDSYANSMRTLSLEFENMKIEIGKELMPVASAGIQVIGYGLRLIAPRIVAVAETVKLYTEAWKNASQQTKNLINYSLLIFGVMAAAPKAIALVRTAVRLLTVDVFTLGGAMNALLGIAGLLLAGAAVAKLKKQVDELKKTQVDTVATNDIVALGDSADISTEAVDELSDSLDGLSDASKGLDTFLASFDEANKVGGNTSLMSSVVNADDIANILGFSDGLSSANDMINNLNGSVDGFQNKLDSLTVPDIASGTLLDGDWWKETLGLIDGFIHEWATDPVALYEDFVDGCGMIEDWMGEHMPHWKKFWEDFGEEIYDAIHSIKDEWESMQMSMGEQIFDMLHPNADDDGQETFKYTSKSGITRDVQKYNSDGTETELYKKYKAGIAGYAAGGFPNKGSLFIAGEAGAELIGNFGGSQTKVINQSQMYQLAQPPAIEQNIFNSYHFDNSDNSKRNDYFQSKTINNNDYSTQTQSDGGKQSPIVLSPTIQIDGRKITAVVVDNINQMTRSSGNSPLIQLG